MTWGIDEDHTISSQDSPTMSILNVTALIGCSFENPSTHDLILLNEWIP